MKHIICYSNFFSLFPVRAAESIAKELVTILLERDYSVTVFVPNFDSKEASELEVWNQRYNNKLKVHKISSFSKEFVDRYILVRLLLSVFWYLPLTLRALFSTPNDAVLISLYHPTHFASVSATITASLRRVPHIIWVRDLFPVADYQGKSIRTWPYLLLHKLVSWSLNKASVCCFISREIRDFAVTHYPLGVKTEILPSMVNTARRPNNYANIPVLKPINKTLLTFVGEIFPARIPTLLILLKAIRQLLNANYSIHLMIVGHGYGLTELERVIRELSLEQHVTITGKVPNELVPQYIRQADIAIGMLNKSCEVMGSVTLKMLEYMASSLPIISASTSVAANAIIDGYNGVLVKPDDDASVADAIKRLIENPDLRKTLGKNAKDYVEKHFSTTAVGNELEQILSTLGRETR